MHYDAPCVAGDCTVRRRLSLCGRRRRRIDRSDVQRTVTNLCTVNVAYYDHLIDSYVPLSSPDSKL